MERNQMNYGLHHYYSAHQAGSKEGIYYSLCAHQTGSQRRAFIIHFVHIRLEVTLTGNNNNNEYLEHLTHTGPKRLHILYIYILSTFNTYNMNAHTHAEQEGIYYSLCVHQAGTGSHTHWRAFITHFVHIRLEVTGGHLLLTLCTSGWKSQEGIYYSLCVGHLLLTLCTSGWKSQEGIYYSLCVHQAGSHRRAFITHFVYIRLEVTGGHLLLTLCTSGWKSQEGIYYSLCVHQAGSHRRAFQAGCSLLLPLAMLHSCSGMMLQTPK